MPRTLKFYGASDDLFEIEGYRGDEPDEIGRKATVCVFDRQGNGLVVAASYVHAGTWAIGIAPLNEDQPLPGWPMKWEAKVPGYTTVLTIEAPDDAVMKLGD